MPSIFTAAGAAPREEDPEQSLQTAEDHLLTTDGEERLPAAGAWRRRAALVGAVSATAAIAIGIAATSSGMRSSMRLTGSASEGTVLAAADDASCAAFGSDCRSSKCCKAGGKTGYQCFQKNKNWAQCMEECEPGVHPGETEATYDANGVKHLAKWSCDKLGDRGAPDPCSAPGEDCSETQCCSAARGGAGMTCFKKDDTWSACFETCPKGWDCEQRGNRTKYPAGCGWAGGSCADTHLCCNKGFSCAVKDATWTACTLTKKMSTWSAQIVPIPADWEGTVLGGSRDQYVVQPAAKGQDVAGTSLYCFMAYLPGSYEVGLQKIAEKMKASIYACDAHDIFESWQSAKAGWDTGEATLSNTDVFINVWENMRKSGKYMQHDWTVKVDADAVVLPDRLKAHLAGLRPPAYRPIYIKNNGMDPGMGNDGFLGAVEVFSKQAVQIYFDNAAGCRQSLGIQAGEDGYFKGCMDALGVGYMTDANMFNPDKSPGACSMQERAAFHPLKTVKNWKCCVDIVNGINHLVEYGDCKIPEPEI